MTPSLPHYYEINLTPFEQMLDLRYLMNSYKLYWFAGILEEIGRGNKVIPFRKLVSWMVAKCWYSILQFKIHLGWQDVLYRLVEYIYELGYLELKSTEQDIVSYLDTSQNPDVIKLIKHFYQMVPYRLLYPFLREKVDTKHDHKINKQIKELSHIDPDVLYTIDESNKQIIINDKWLLYIMHNQMIIDDWLSYKTVSFLQRRNPNIPAIINKLQAPRERNHGAAIKYWKTINERTGLVDIYSHNKLDNNDISIDHFVPWSFVLHDQLWNLVPTTKSINSSKSDRLPDYDTYMDAFCDLQYMGFKTALDTGMKEKALEDYLTLGNIEIRKDFPKQAFITAIRDSINPLHTLARNQGFEIWQK